MLIWVIIKYEKYLYRMLIKFLDFDNLIQSKTVSKFFTKVKNDDFTKDFDLVNTYKYLFVLKKLNWKYLVNKYCIYTNTS